MLMVSLCYVSAVIKSPLVKLVHMNFLFPTPNNIKVKT